MSEITSQFAIIDRSDPTGEKESAHRVSVLESIQDYAKDALSLLTPVEEIWQPSDYLPDLTLPNWKEEVDKVREIARGLTDEILVVLVGDMITEEALPTYQTELNRMKGIEDPTGTSDSPWAKWSRGWTAEENRHGDLLNKYLYLIGQVDMRAIEQSIHRLISGGFESGSDQNAYKGFVYTSFQERATKISHANVGKLAKKHGDTILGNICGRIGGDEARHEEAYKRFMDKVFEVDPERSILAFRDMMKKMITMPAANMDEGSDDNLFDKFSAVAQRIGVYTTHDYADIIEHLVERWNIPDMSGLSGEAAKAQDYLSSLTQRYRRLAERLDSRKPDTTPLHFSWLAGRAV